jgi:hypothetical protein
MLKEILQCCKQILTLFCSCNLLLRMLQQVSEYGPITMKFNNDMSEKCLALTIHLLWRNFGCHTLLHIITNSKVCFLAPK